MDTSETFLKLLSSELCHGKDAIVLGNGPSLQCTTCKTTPIPDVYDYICSQNREPLDSCRLAQAYYAWTGDKKTPVSFTLVGGGDGILSIRIERQLLSRLKDTVLILEAVNAPFLATGSTSHEPDSKHREYTENFAANYVEAMEETTNLCKASIPRNTQIVLNQIIKHMHTALENSECPEMFKYYFEKLVPFVKHCNPDGMIPRLQSTKPPLNWAHRLVLRMEESQKIRNAYSQFSIPFDVIFVMLGCYVSNVNVDVVSNWMFDLMTRMCNGQFFWKRSSECIFVKSLQGFMSLHFDRRRNTKLYYALREIYRGNAAESLSSFLPQYAQIDKLINEKFRVAGASESLVQVAIMHFFPSVLFGDPAEYYAFTIALAHVAKNMDSKTGQVVKGTYSKARTIYRTLKKFFQGVKKFSEIQNCWTKDTLDQFFVYDSELQDEILALAKLLVLEVDDTDDDNRDTDEMRDKEMDEIQDPETTTLFKKDDYKTHCEEHGRLVGGGLVEMQRQDAHCDHFEEMDIEESMDM